MSEVGNSNRGLVRHLSTEDSVPQVNIEINKTSDKGFQKAIAKHNRGEVLTTNEISASSGALNQYSIEETIGVGAFALVISMEGYGTDAFLYLSRLNHHDEPLL